MIKTKLHNPVIANNSHIENAVVQKVNNSEELAFSDIENASPIVPETGRIWFNTDKGSFNFANISTGGTGDNYVDEFLSRTDLRDQEVVSKVDFQDTVRINNSTDGTPILIVDSLTKDISVNGNNKNILLDSNLTTNIDGNSNTTIGGTLENTVTGIVTEFFSSNLNTSVGGTVHISVVGDVTENFSSNQKTNIAGNLGLKVGQIVTLTDSSDNVKIEGNNLTNILTINYATFNVNGQTETHTLSDKFVVNNGSTDKFIIDNTNDKVSVIYSTVETISTDIISDFSNTFKLTDSGSDKIIADNVNNTLDIHYAENTITGNATVDGNMLITGDLTVGGQTTKVDVAAENMTIADNVIILNSNLTTEDPRLASAIVEDEDVDNNAGVAVNRGSEGILDLIKWIESTDTSTTETLKEATAQVSIWNYEAATPSYELHQIIDEYTLGRQTTDLSGTSWVGYDGEEGSNYTTAILGGATQEEALDYSFKIDNGTLDNVIDSVVQEIDAIKFNERNTVRVGETPSAGTEFTITHNLGTVFVDVVTQREDGGDWFFDIMPIQVVDANTIKIAATEATKIRYMITAIEGFDVNQATELVIV